ncbi:MaoC/PaaZ C-terminal domain-containing protein [Amycolatopsis dendrobii]|uniref:Acyl dehydratase n=1 Tax=Amycolatopsis dendrobii TaxID=2760662 RepID=A0A7W3ZCW2_9PSEU|nr:MaoC/PaaZ C-terminal domain-containing protein [Amycolatopsis dendrobii]MBB1156254.1 acyl dehydratase [Amycolatopsis dendrobii]
MTLALGDRLPELAIPFDRTAIVATAIASQDFEDVHHDPGKAAERGMPDIFISINATNGFIDRYLTDVCGPATRIRRVSLRLGLPLFPGDTLTFAGEVIEATEDAVTIKVAGSHERGVHVSARVTVAA